MKFKAIIFDLDDTLFLEEEYVLSGFKEVALFLKLKFHINSNDSYRFLNNWFQRYGRKNIFNHLLERYSLKLKGANINSLVEDLVKVYRKHKPEINLNPSVLHILEQIRLKKIKIIIATDGLPLMQQNKFYALGLDKLVDNITYCWSHDAAKPSSKCFNIAAESSGFNIQDCIIVGDHPIHDIMPARILGIQAYRIKTGRFIDLPDSYDYPPHKTFTSLEDFFLEVLK